MSNESHPKHLQINADERSFESICESVKREFGTLLDSMPDGVIIADDSGTIVLANSQAEKLFGYGRGDLVSQEVELLIPARYRTYHVGLRNAYIAMPEVRPMGQDILSGLRQDGSEFPTEISLSPIRTNEGLLICVAVRDVTERVRIDKALRASEEQVRSQALEERYYDLYANSPDMCASVEAATGRIVDCNNTLVETTGFTREELFALPHVSHLYHPDCEHMRKEVFRAFVETGLVNDAELQLLCKDGGVINVSLSLTAVRDAEGRIIRSRSVWRDITSRKRSEKVLRSIIEGTSLTFGETYFRSLVRHIAKALDVRHAFVSELCEQQGRTLRLLAFWSVNGFEDTYEYDPKGKPCELVISEGLVSYPEHVQQLFPNDRWLSEFHVESYLAIPLLNIDGRPLGHLGVAHDARLPDTLAAQSLLRVFSTRAGAELMRMRAEKAVQEAHDELETRVRDRTAELETANIQLQREIAERVSVEQDLQQTHGELNRILDSIPNYLWSADIDGEGTISYRYYSPVVKEITGRPPEFFMTGADAWISTIHPDDRPRLQQTLERIVSGESTREEEEYRVVRPDGTVRWVSDSVIVTPMNNGDMRLDGVVGDITERMQVEHALRASEEQVRLLLDSTVESIYGLDLQGNCTFCNRACLETLGYERADELRGKNMHDLIHHTRPDGSPYPLQKCKIYEAFKLGKGTHVDDEVLWKADGSSFAAEYRSFPVSRDGELVGSVVTFLDITEQRRVAETLRTQQSELTHAARLSTLGEMAAGLAHELNQPLTAMSAFAEGALMRLDRGKLQEPEIASIFSRIAEDAQRAGDIIRRLRDFVQKRIPQRHQIGVNELIRDVYKLVEPDTKQQSIEIQFAFENGLPVVEADPIEIQQVVINLIRNAYDALVGSNSDKRIIMISSYERQPDRVEVVVEDSGPGISHEMVEQVFEPFHTSKTDGLGIGLGICQNIIEAHGGKIWVGRSSLGGASVHFDLPSHQQKDNTDAT